MSESDNDDFTRQSSREGFNRVTASSGVAYLDGHGQIIGELPQGFIIGQQFRVRNTLGEGGMSYVYLCDDISLNRQVALKVMRAGGQSNDQAFMRFHREGQAVAMLSHNNVVKVHSLSFTETDQPFLVMEVVQGVPLSHLIEVSGPLKLPRALKFLIQICDGIAHAHENGVIHRDLKLSNIMLIDPDSHDERIKILDFGIAKVVSETSVKMTQTGEVFGSPAYMSPEQALGKAVDMATDQYSLGCIAFELLTGRTPFSAENYLAVLMAHVQEKAPSVNEFAVPPVPANVERTIARLLAKDAKDRFKNIEEVKKAFSGDVKVAAPAVVRIRKPINLRYVGFAAAFLLCVSVIASLMFFMRPPTEKAAAASEVINKIPRNISLLPVEDTLTIASKTQDDGYLAVKMLSAINRTTFGSELVGRGISDNALKMMTAAKNIAKLNLSDCLNITPAGIATLAKFPKLEKLELNNTKADDSDLEAFGKMKTLADLSVDECDAITDKGVSYLSAMPNLNALSISGNPSLTPESLKFVSQIKGLKVLHIDNDAIGAGFKYLAPTGIVWLSASGCIPTTEDLAPLATMQRLERLYLDKDGVDEKTLLALAKLPHLRILSIKKSAITEGALKRFKKIAPKILLQYDQGLIEK